MYTETIERQIFTFDELSDAAKEKARDWWRGCESAEFDAADLHDDFENVAAILGVKFNTQAIPLMGGGTRQEPVIYWQGFSSQGDGACFEGRYSYAKHMRKAIREYVPQDYTLHQIADSLFEVQQKNFYCLSARTKHCGHYYHSGCMSIEVFRNGIYAPHDVGEAVSVLLRQFADWIYSRIEKEYEYRMSDENVDDAIRANEYEFLSDGSRV